MERFRQIDELNTVADIPLQLELVADEESRQSHQWKLGRHRTMDARERDHDGIPLQHPEDIHQYFDRFAAIPAESVLRPPGDTTFFTTAGVQRIESMHRDASLLQRERFVVCQPVIRSQYMDRVKVGVSTSFVNVSAEVTHATPQDFSDAFSSFLALLHDRGVSLSELRFVTSEDPNVVWGKRRFRNIAVTILLRGIELGECVLLLDYPHGSSETMRLVDLGFSVERVNWGVVPGAPFFPEFGTLYEAHPAHEHDALTGALDTVRSMALIAGAGVKPSNHDQGYRLRQFSKRFVQRNRGYIDDVDASIHASLLHWAQWEAPGAVREEEVQQLVERENERNFNSAFLSQIHRICGVKRTVDVNQPKLHFLRKMRQSVGDDLVEKVLTTIP